MELSSRKESRKENGRTGLSIVPHLIRQVGPSHESSAPIEHGAYEPKRTPKRWCTKNRPMRLEPPFFLSKKEEADLKITENPDKWVKMRNH